MILSSQKTIYSLGTKGDWFDPKLKDFADDFFKEKTRLKIQSKLLLDYDYSKIFNPKLHTMAEFKTLPQSYSTDSTIDIFDDKIVIFNGVKNFFVDTSADILMIKNRKLAENFIKWHSLIWELLHS
jgi:hypothetical protein